MVYKRYIKRGGKVFGPYYYESHRNSNGNVTTSYVKSKPKNNSINSLLMFVLVGLILFGIFYYFENSSNINSNLSNFKPLLHYSFTGNVIDEGGSDSSPSSSEASSTSDSSTASTSSTSSSDSSPSSDSSSISTETQTTEATPEAITEASTETQISEQITETSSPDSGSSDSSGAETTINSEYNETTPIEITQNDSINENNQTINETLEFVNSTLINETFTNETLINNTSLDETLINQTLTNQTWNNETLINETFYSANLTIQTKQYQAVINRPVKWIKIINVTNESAIDEILSEVRNISIDLPKEATEIQIKTGSDIEQSLSNAENYAEEFNQSVSKEDIAPGSMTGLVISESNNFGIITRVYNWLLGLFKSSQITGNVVEDQGSFEVQDQLIETSDSKSLDVAPLVQEIVNNISDNNSIAIEYTTPAPIAEENLTSQGKQITILSESEYNYTEILAYTLIDDVTGMQNIPINDTSKIKLYWYASTEDAKKYGYSEKSIEASEEFKIETLQINTSKSDEEINSNQEVLPKFEDNTSNNSEQIINSTIDNVASEPATLTAETQTTETTQETPTEDVANSEIAITGNVVASNEEPGMITKLVGGIMGITGNVIETSEDNLKNNSNSEATSETLETSNQNNLIKVEVSYNAYDLDGDGFVDYIEWVVPHLSTQTYQLILITKAEHLDSNRNSIEDIYNFVKSLDSSLFAVPNGDYIRAKFEKNLTIGKDMTLYANGSGVVRVYNENKNDSIGEFLINSENISEYKIYPNYTSSDTYDLGFMGNISVDYIVDPLTCPDAGGNWVVSNNYVLSTSVNCSTITIGNGVTLIINSTAAGNQSVNLSAFNITISAGGIINGNGTGYLGGLTGNPGTAGFGPGGGGYGTYGGGGASHASAGGAGSNGAANLTIYDSVTQPIMPGSGGGGIYTGRGTSGNGGSAIYLYLYDTLVNNGSIFVDGTSGNSGTTTYSGGGGGSGGSIFINASQVNGIGILSAAGGTGGATTRSSSGGGGGGSGGIISLIARDYDSYAGSLIVSSGSGYSGTVAGSVYRPASSTLGNVIIPSGQTTTWTLGNFTFNNFTLESGATLLVVNAASPSNCFGGIGGGSGPGVSSSGSGAGGGAGHGANGGAGSSAGGTGGASYDNSTWPSIIGSGGGGGSSTTTAMPTGGFGGGQIYLNVVNTANINGTLSADGTNALTGSNGGGGGGSGVSILLNSSNFIGSGTITAKGGNGSLYAGNTGGGGGAGGRLGIFFTTSQYTGTLTTANVAGGSVNHTSAVAGGTGTLSISDFIAPTIVYDGTSENTSTTLTARNNIFVSATASDDISLASINITLYNSQGLTNYSVQTYVTNATNTYTYNFTNLVDGVYSFNATAKDSTGNSNSSGSRTVTIDYLSPNADYSTGTEIASSYLPRNYAFVNVSSTAPDVQNVTINLYNTSLVNSTLITSAPYQLNFTNLADGIYYFNATLKDPTHSNSTTTRTVTIDTISPQLTFAYPVSGTTYEVDVTNFSYNYIEANPASCWYSLNGGTTNTTITCGNNVTGLTASSGSNSWNLWMNDSAGHLTNSALTFTKNISRISFCRTLSDSGAYTVLNNISSVSGNCLTVNSNNVIIEGNGFTFSGDRVGDDYGVYINGRSNVTVQNFGNITNFAKGVGVISSSNCLVKNLSISSSTDHGIYVQWASTNTFRDLILNGNAGAGIYVNFYATLNNLINVTAQGNSGNGIGINDNSNNNTLTNCTVSGNSQSGVAILTSVGNTSINNLYSSSNLGSEIYDNSGNSKINYLRYENQYGKIEWTNTSDGNFLKNLGVEGSLILGQTLNITQSFIALATSSFSSSNISSSANITLYGVNTSTIRPVVYRNSSALCTSVSSPSCYNFTNLNVANPVFNISSWSNYTIIDLGSSYLGITINSPANTTYTTSNILVNLSVLNSSSTTFYNGSANNTYTTPASHSFGQGSTNLLVYATDGYGNYNDANVVFFVDSILPQITIVSPSVNSYYNSPTTATMTYVETNPASCWYSLNGGINTSFVCNNNISGMNPVEGLNSLIIWMNDTLGNKNSSSVSFYKDTTPPQITITQPSSLTSTSTSINVEFSSSDSGVGVSSRWFNDGVNNISYSTPTTATLGQGNTTIILYSNDSLNNLNSTSLNVFVDSIAPAVSFIYPLNVSSLTSNSFSLSYSASDTTLDDCYWSSNNGASNTTLASCSTNITSSWGQGWNNITLYANDSLGNIGSTNVVFFVDSIYPTITINSPNNDSDFGTNYFAVNVSAVDTNFNNITTRLYNSSLSLINTTSLSTTPFTISFVSLGDGIYYFNSTACDILGNCNSSETRKLYIDSGLPTLSLSSPSDNSYLNYTNVNYSLSVSDTTSGISNYSLNIYNSTSLVNQTTKTVGFRTNSLTDGINVTLNTGNYTWFYQAYDLAGNSNLSTNRTVIIDMVLPQINITYPVEGMLYASRPNTINYTTSDNFGVDKCWNTFDSRPLSCLGYVTGLSNVVAEGSNTWNIYTKDLAGNLNSTSVTFLVDTQAPRISFIDTTTATGNYSNVNYVYANLTASDTRYANATIYIYTPSELFYNLTSTETQFNLTKLMLQDDMYYLNASAWDLGGNSNSTETRRIMLDRNFPQISFGAGMLDNGSSFSSNSLFANISLDEQFTKNITFYLFEETTNSLVSSKTFTNSTNSTYFDTSEDGLYDVEVIAYDWVGHSNSTGNRTFYKDTIGPVFSGYKYNSNSSFAQVNITARDVPSGVDSVWAEILDSNNTSIGGYEFSRQAGDLYNGNYSVSITNITNIGDYRIQIYANDTGNATSNSSYYFDIYPTTSFRVNPNVTNSNVTYNFTFFGSGNDLGEINTSLSSNSTLKNREYDVSVNASDNSSIVFYNLTLGISSPNINIQQINNSIQSTPSLYKPLKVLAVELNNLTLGNGARIEMDYSGKFDSGDYPIINESQLTVHKCSSWSISSQTCSSDWIEVNGTTINTLAKKISFDVSGFSAYEITEYRCGNGICETAYGETTITCSLDCSSEQTNNTTTQNNNGGGGGGGGAPKIDGSKSLSLSTLEISEELRVHDSANRSITVSNPQTTSVEASVTLDGEAALIAQVYPTNLTIPPLSTRAVTLMISADKEGFYSGEITIKSATSELKVPVKILVRGNSDKLMDLNVQIDNKKVAKGEDLDFRLAAFNLGKLSRYDINIRYEVIGSDNKTYASQQEAIAIETSLNLVRSIAIPRDMPLGSSSLVVTAFYDENSAKSVSSFEVVKPEFTMNLPAIIKEGLPLFMTAILLIFFAVVGYYYFTFMRKKLFEKEMEEIKKKSIYKFPDFDLLPKSHFAYIGLIADTKVKTYLDYTQLNRHTLIAGGTGSGKTISGMVIAEELLRRDQTVIVFDPVGQWSGFFNKDGDKMMLSKFRKFGMSSARSFGGKVIQITKDSMNLDILKYMNTGKLTILRMDALKPNEADTFIEQCLEKIYRANLSEVTSLKNLLVLDEVHRLLPKYGGRKAYMKLEQAVREFRKWGIGLLMISQVLTDFKGAIRGNIGTEIQLFSRYEGDIKRVRERHGSDISKLIPKLPIGIGMVEAGGYNRGSPYFVDFRPIYHSPLKLTDKELARYVDKKPYLSAMPAKTSKGHEAKSEGKSEDSREEAKEDKSEKKPEHKKTEHHPTPHTSHKHKK